MGQRDEQNMAEPDRRPLIVTARMEADAQVRFDALRQRYFPPERNWLAAHVTLFHALPGRERRVIEHVLAGELVAFRAIPVAVREVRFTGNGVSFGLDSPALQDLRAGLAGRLASMLTRQDQQGFRPHVTVQNKVLPPVARALHRTLSDEFAPWNFAVTGLDLWFYDGGPWEPTAHFPIDPQVRAR